MTPATTRLVDLIDRLAEDLRKSQKAETAEFFATLKHRVQEASDVDELRRVLAEIRRMGAISQYAGFSHRQDALLSEIHSEAISLDPVSTA